MKKKLLFLPLLVLGVISLDSCNQDYLFKPTYGSQIDTEIQDLSYSQLYKKNVNEEAMVVAIYPGKDTSCSCWRTFEQVLNAYVERHDTIVYSIDVFAFRDQDEKYGLVLSEYDPSLVFFYGGKKFDQYVYSVKNTQSFFKKYDAFVDFMNEKTAKPQLIYTNLEKARVSKKEEDEYVLMHTYHSCPDCTYCLPNVVEPFILHHNTRQNIYLLDLENEEEFQNEEGKFDSSCQAYLDFKDEFELSKAGNETYGFNKGYVPTIQYYKNGVLSDSSVYFNDTIEEIDGKYIVTSSFYSEDRLSALKYLDGVETKVLQGLELSEEDVTVYEEINYIMWDQSAASKYHNPLFEAFLNYYVK